MGEQRHCLVSALQMPELSRLSPISDAMDSTVEYKDALTGVCPPQELTEIHKVMDRFPLGSLVTIAWISSDNSYVFDEGVDEGIHGVDLACHEPALLLKHLPERAFKNFYGWVVPFECVHMGVVRMSTTYAAKVIGRMPHLGERK